MVLFERELLLEDGIAWDIWNAAYNGIADHPLRVAADHEQDRSRRALRRDSAAPALATVVVHACEREAAIFSGPDPVLVVATGSFLS